MRRLKELFTRPARVYMDYAAMAPIAPEARDAMIRALQFIGNPGAIHTEGVEAARSLARSREIVAAELGCKAREIIFTGSLTEANNLAIIGHARFLERTARTLRGTHWIVSGIEHASVLDCFAEIERMGGAVTHVLPDEKGVISPETIRDHLRIETVFVSLDWANSEIGTIQPLSRIASVLRDHERVHGTRVLLHADAGQAPLYVSPHVHTLGVDLLTLGAHKLHGPHGVGVVYVDNRADLVRILFGGNQERGLRPGTEDVPVAAGCAAALQEASRVRARETARVSMLRDTLARGIVTRIPEAVINGETDHALPHILNISIPDINGEYTVLALDRAGIAISTKSACKEGKTAASHVVASLGGAQWRACNTLRFSLGRGNTSYDIDRTIQALVDTVHCQHAERKKQS